MEISYKRETSNNYMIVSDGRELEAYREKMLRENEIECLLNFYTMEIDEKFEYMYDITGMESVKDFLERNEPTFENILKIFSGIKYALLELEKYLISEKEVLLKPEAIFMSRKNGRVKMCFFPGNDESGLQEVMEHILTRINDGDETSEAVYELYDMSFDGGMGVGEIVDFIQEKMTPALQILKIDLTEKFLEKDEEIFGGVSDVQNEVAPRKLETREKSLLGKIIEKIFGRVKGVKKSFGGDKEEYQDFIIEPEIAQPVMTTMIGQDELLKRPCMGKLIYDGINDEENFMIDKEVFTVGTKQDENDGVIKSATVSRFHARIFCENENYFIEDLNSTNGTFLNGKILSSHTRMRLSPMDRIDFADVTYLFM